MNSTNTTVPGVGDGQKIAFKHAWSMPGWFEPVLIATILVLSCLFTRRKSAPIFSSRAKQYRPILGDTVAPPLSRWNSDDSLNDDDESSTFSISTSNNPTHKYRKCCGLFPIWTPNTSQFSDYFFSRVLHKFPFLIEMFYWILTYALYQTSRKYAENHFGDIWATAEGHGKDVLWLEHKSFLRWFFWLEEVDVQRWFLREENAGYLTFLNRFYALVHIPATVGFIAWYYAVAPTHDIFAMVRRTMTLTNWLAFTIFAFYPCMPPRLLPEEYGFMDTVRKAQSQSVWMKGKYVNSLAAMPSMHFGYSFLIGCTLIYHSGAFSWIGFGYPEYALVKGDGPSVPTPRLRRLKQALYCVVGIWYPLMILAVIVATANHYWLDAVVAVIVAIFSLFTNKIFLIFLPLEDWLFWCLRAQKPKPNCGMRKR